MPAVVVVQGLGMSRRNAALVQRAEFETLHERQASTLMGLYPFESSTLLSR